MIEFVKKILGRKEEDLEGWNTASQPPGPVFPFPKGTKLMAREKIMVALPTAIISNDEKFEDVIHCDNNARLSIPPGSDVIYIKLSKGMVISLEKSSQMAIVAKDERPRKVAIKHAEQMDEPAPEGQSS